MADDAQETPRTADDLRNLTFGFDEHPLEHFKGLTAEQIEAHPGIGPKFRIRIQEALAELYAVTGEAPVETPLAEPTSGDSHAQPAVDAAVAQAHDDDLEPVGPGTGGPLVILGVVVLVLLILVSAIWIVQDRDGSAELQVRLSDAYQQVKASQATFDKLAEQSASQAERQAAAVYAAARARNLGAALAQIDDLEASLATVSEAVAAATSAEHATGDPEQSLAEPHAAQPDRRTLLAAANEALDRARAALMMTQPQTQSGLESACRNLELAVRALGGDEVKE